LKFFLVLKRATNFLLILQGKDNHQPTERLTIILHIQSALSPHRPAVPPFASTGSDMGNKGWSPGKTDTAEGSPWLPLPASDQRQIEYWEQVFFPPILFYPEDKLISFLSSRVGRELAAVPAGSFWPVFLADKSMVYTLLE